jgi:CHAD domain-containing protein
MGADEDASTSGSSASTASKADNASSSAGAGSTDRPIEVELKYRVDDLGGAETLLQADHLADFQPLAGKVRPVQFEDVYVDTGDRALTRAGFAVRLRQTGGGTTVGVKSMARTNGAGRSVRREELEGPADRSTPVVDWPSSSARSLVLEHAGDGPLVELITVRQLRRKRVIRATDARVELSLDEVDIVARGRVIDRFVEFEAELVKGDEAALGRLAEVLDASPSLRRSATSKFEAAMAALDGHTGTVVDAVPAPPSAVGADARRSASEAASSKLVVGKSPGVTADDHVAEAGRKVLRFHLARMLDHEDGTRSGKDPEDLHKMRVATRRQRAAWRVFGGSFRKKRSGRYRDGLREIARRLGAVRDLDVQIGAADAYRADQPANERRALQPLLDEWSSHRDDARLLLVRELDSDGHRRFIDDYKDFVRTEGALVLPVRAVEPHRVRDTAPSRIWTAYEDVRAFESVLRWADVETLHELRISAKWLRYSLEFVREALSDEAATLIERVVALQDHIGLMNDAHITAGMARTFLVEHAGDLSAAESAAIGRYLVDREREVARLRRAIGVPWRGVAGLRFRRGLGRVMAEI